MIKTNVMRPLARVNAFVTAAVLIGAAFLPALLLGDSASGAQLTDRFIDMSASQTSEGSGRDGGDAAGQDVTYTVGFTLTQAHANLEGIVIEFCTDSPIIGDACTGANANGFNLNTGTLDIANGSEGTGAGIDSGDWTINGASDTDTLVLTYAAGENLGAVPVEFDLGSTGAADGITNPTTAGTFYARILTYTDDTVAAAYDDQTPGVHLDDGGIALSVANELTVTARVQEVLQFCIGTETDSGLAGFGDVTGDDCTDVAGTDLDLGVVDSSAINTTELEGNNGLAMIRTNALNGAVVYYKAEQDTTSGQLKIAGQACSGASVADPCFNSVAATQTAIVAGTEDFGMTLREQSEASGGATTNALVCNAEYDNDGSCGAGAATGYAWLDTGAFATIAASSGPIDDETVRIAFAATASPTTPTGLYTVTANFVATSTF